MEEAGVERRERVACICGATQETDAPGDPHIGSGGGGDGGGAGGGLWLQCDTCDAWLHAACCGFRRAPRGDAPSPPPSATHWHHRRHPPIGSIESRMTQGTPLVVLKLTSWMLQIMQFIRCEFTRLGGEICQVLCSVGVRVADCRAGGFQCGPCKRQLALTPVVGNCGATLIVCPTPILRQWQEEIARHVQPGAYPTQLLLTEKPLPKRKKENISLYCSPSGFSIRSITDCSLKKLVHCLMKCVSCSQQQIPHLDTPSDECIAACGDGIDSGNCIVSSGRIHSSGAHARSTEHKRRGS